MVVLSSEDGLTRALGTDRNAALAESGRCLGPLTRPLRRVTLLAWLFVASLSCAPNDRDVVLYSAQDQVYAEPILATFTRETGIRVRAIYDNEAVKTVGLANRLLAERSHPQCDIFWNNEELRTRQLAAAGVFDRSHAWVTLGFRSRQFIVNTNRIPLSRDHPQTLSELVEPRWRGKVALAYPLFGTTATHFIALRTAWGDQRWRRWCQELQANRPLLVDGNSQVAKRVATGEAWIGITDSDDIAAVLRETAPVIPTPIQDGQLTIRNTLAVVRPRRSSAAEGLWNYLQSPRVAQQLLAMQAIENIATAHPAPPLLINRTATGVAEPDPESLWASMLQDLPATTDFLKKTFLR